MLTYYRYALYYYSVYNIETKSGSDFILYSFIKLKPVLTEQVYITTYYYNDSSYNIHSVSISTRYFLQFNGKCVIDFVMIPQYSYYTYQYLLCETLYSDYSEGRGSNFNENIEGAETLTLFNCSFDHGLYNEQFRLPSQPIQ